MPTENFKKELFSQFGTIAKALSNGHRLELLEFLAQSEQSVEDLAKATKLTIANTSQHLQALRRCGLVDTRTQGHRVIYRLTDDEVMKTVRCIQKIAEKNLNKVNDLIDSFLTSKDSLEPVTCNELLKKVEQESVTVLDVRPQHEYLSGHIHSAINIPLDDLENKLSLLSKDHEIIAYCRGAYCMLSYEAVSKLRSLGYEVRRLEEGYPEWKSLESKLN